MHYSKKVHVCLLSAFNYMLTLSLLSTAQNQRGLNWTGTLLLVYFWNFCINTITANHLAIWCELQPRSLVFPCFLWLSFTFFFLVECIRLAQFSFLLRRRLYTSQNRHICTLWKTILVFCSANWRHKKSKPISEFENNYGNKPALIYMPCRAWYVITWRSSLN